MDIISDRWRWFARGRRRVLAIVSSVTLLAGLAAIGFVTDPASALHRQDIFELDGNTVDDPAGSPWDWTKFFGATGNRITPLPTDFLDSGFDSDYAFPDTSTFTGGSKDTLNIGTGWSCTDSNNLGGKFDIVNAYSTIYEVPTTADGFTAGDQLLFFGIERAATEGDGNMGFWFLKDGTVDCEKTSNGKAPNFTGNHQDGDIFVVAGFSNGGTNATVSAYYWNGGADGSLSATPFVDANEVCTQTAGTGSKDACGIVNTAEIATGSAKPWPSPDKNGGDLDVNAFYEGFVRVPAADVTGCFATFVANTRSSTSTTATIMDFSRGSFPTCQPSTTMTGLATPTVANPKIVVVGDSVTYTFPETNDGNVALTNVYVVTNNTACNSALTPASVATLAEGATANFSCTLTTGATPADTTIRAVGHGTSQFGDVTVCGADALPFPAPATAVCDADEQASARSVSILPSTAITIGASPTTVRQGDNVTLTITETNDGTAPTGFDSSLDLTSVGISLSGASGCTPALQSGDTNTDSKLNKGETWTYTCTFQAPASSFTVTATGTGTVLAGTANARVVTFCSPTCTAGQFHDADERASVNVTVINPTTSLTVTASAQITYTFSETNDSANAPLTPPTPGVRASVLTIESPTTCNVSAPVYVSGDQASGTGSGILEPGETWVFTCVGSLAGPSGDTGSTEKDVTGIGHGVDGTGVDVTYPADTQERDRVTVTITNRAQGA